MPKKKLTSNQPINSKLRFYWIDALKAFSIFGVVYIHSSSFFKITSDFEDLSGYFFRFGVPIFIIVSFFLQENYLLQKNRNNFSVAKFYEKRLARLIYPYLVWTIFYAIGQFVLNIRRPMDFGPVYAWQGQYFFIILFQLTLIYPIIRLIRIDLKLVALSLFLTFVGLYLPFSYMGIKTFFPITGESPFYYWLFYLMLGVYLARINSSIRHNSSRKNFSDNHKKKSLYLLLLAIISPLTIVIEQYIRRMILADIGYPYLSASVLMISTLLFTAFFYFQPQTKNTLLKEIVAILSKYSLGIFCLNPIIISIVYYLTDFLEISTKIPQNGYFNLYAIFTRILTTIIVIIACIMASKTIESIKLSFLVK